MFEPETRLSGADIRLEKKGVTYEDIFNGIRSGNNKLEVHHI